MVKMRKTLNQYRFVCVGDKALNGYGLVASTPIQDDVGGGYICISMFIHLIFFLH